MCEIALKTLEQNNDFLVFYDLVNYPRTYSASDRPA